MPDTTETTTGAAPGTEPEKIDMMVMTRLQRDRVRVASIRVLIPLIERARVSRALKERVLVLGVGLVPRAEFSGCGTPQEVDESLVRLVACGVARQEGDAFELLAALPALSCQEARRAAHKFLATWPARERAAVEEVFGAADEATDEDE